jgi:predicted transcriptional regulator
MRTIDTSKITDWHTLPMEIMSKFNCCLEWAIMERLWFKSNHNDEINLNYLNATTPIKSRGTLLRVINRLVEREWIIKSAIKHGHKYTLDKEAFR